MPTLRRPLSRRMLPGLYVIQGDIEEQFRPMGLRPDPEIGGEQGRKIELVDRLVDGAGEVVGGQRLADFAEPQVMRGAVLLKGAGQIEH